ncbi:MAG TPA: SLATT domain-containing protein, partial [Mucilaginibacter sp.]|nr:SLATT domain-containing protein [Mucilaginibacter sp.]
KSANTEKFIPKPNKYHLDIITKKMSEVRATSFWDRKEYYKKYRINEQINWYKSKSNNNKLKGNLCSFLIITCQLLAAVYLFEYMEHIKFLNLNNILIFLATSTMSIIELNKYKELYQSYALTKQELNIIRTKFDLIQNDSELNDFVLEAEQAISREHTMWLARRGNHTFNI